jgi:hypothetical protein
MDAQQREHEASDNRSQNSDDNIADQTKAGALNNEAGDPASERSDYEPNNQRCHDLTLGYPRQDIGRVRKIWEGDDEKALTRSRVDLSKGEALSARVSIF